MSKTYYITVSLHPHEVVEELMNAIFKHGLMLHSFKDLMKVTKKLQSIDPTFRLSCSLVPSSGCSEITNFVCDFIDNKK